MQGGSALTQGYFVQNNIIAWILLFFMQLSNWRLGIVIKKFKFNEFFFFKLNILTSHTKKKNSNRCMIRLVHVFKN